MLTHEIVHYGRAEAVIAARRVVLEAAYRKHRNDSSASRPNRNVASGRLDQFTCESGARRAMRSKRENFALV